MRINKVNMKKNSDIVNTTLGSWTSNLNWLFSTLALFLQQFITGIIVFIPLLVIMVSIYGNPYENPNNLLILPAAILFITLVLLVSLYFQLGMTKASLNFAFAGKYNFADFFKGYKYYGKGLLLGLLYMVIVIASFIPGIVLTIWASFSFNDVVAVIGIVVMLIPAIFIQILFSQAFFLLVDKGLSPTKCLGESIAIMKGIKLKYFLLFFVVGILIYLPFFLISFALEYMNEGLYYVGQFLLSFLGLIISSYMISLRSIFYKEIKENDRQNQIENSIFIEEEEITEE